MKKNRLLSLMLVVAIMFSMLAPVSAFAASYNITYNNNGGVGTIAPQAAEEGTEVTLSDGAGFSYSGYVLRGWDSNGDNTFDYELGDSYTMPSNDSTMYAVWWTAITVSYDENGGTSTPNDVTYQGNTTTLPDGSDTIRTGYTLLGWTTNSEALVKEYDPGASYTVPTSDTTLYAVWEINNYTYTFDENGGTPEQIDGSADYNTPITLPNIGDITRTHYKLKNWQYYDGSDTQTVNPGATISMPTYDTTFEAIWELIYLDIDGSTPGTTYSITATSITIADSNPSTPEDVNILIGNYQSLTLDNVNIVCSQSNTPALYVGKNVNITLVGTNELTSVSGAAFLIPLYCSATISGAGSLECTSARYAAGIGGDSGAPGVEGNAILGGLTINSGTIIANGGQDAAGIGGGDGGSVGLITINGGTVTATAGSGGGAGIGGGPNGSADVVINGGTVTAYSGTGPAIGSSENESNVEINGGTVKGSGVYGAEAIFLDITGGKVFMNGTSYDLCANGIDISGDAAVFLQHDNVFSYGSKTSTHTHEPGANLPSSASNLTGVGTIYSLSGIPSGWEADATGGYFYKEYILTYEESGGNETLSDETTWDGKVITLPDRTELTKSGYILAGWAESSGAAMPDYEDGASFTCSYGDVILYAVWKTPVNLTYEENGGTPELTDVVGYEGKQVRLPYSLNIQKEGYVLSGWTTDSAALVKEYDPAAFYTMTATNTMLYAVWELPTHYLYFDEQGGNETLSYESFTNGQEITLPNVEDLTKAGYRLSGWANSSGAIVPDYEPGGTFIGGDVDVTLYAVWEEVYTLYFDENGGSPDLENIDFVEDEEITLPDTNDVTMTNYYLAGWSESSSASTVDYASGGTYTGGSADDTLYAVWVSGYSLTFEEEGGAPEQTDLILGMGEETTLPTAAELTKDGYDLIGFAEYSPSFPPSGTPTSADIDYDPGETFTMQISDVVLYAVWGTKVTVSYDANGGTGTIPAEAGYDGKEYSLPGNSDGMSKTGYSLAGWSVISTDVEPDYWSHATYTMGAGDVTLYAIWEQEEYTLFYEENGGSPSLSNPSLYYGDEVTLPAAGDLTQSDSHLVGWDEDEYAVSPTFEPGAMFTMPADDVILYAIWADGEYLIEYDEQGGTPEQTDVWANDSDLITLPGTEDISRGTDTLLGWSIDSEDTNPDDEPGDTYYVSGDAVLYAIWQGNNTLTYELDGGDPVGPSNQQNFVLGEGLTLWGEDDVWREGYRLYGWSTTEGGEYDYLPGETITAPEADFTLYAVWGKAIYFVNYYDNDGSDQGYGWDSFFYDDYDNSVLKDRTEIIRSGYMLAGWTLTYGTSSIDYEEGANISMPASNLDLFAVWEEYTYTLYFDEKGGTEVDDIPVAGDTSAGAWIQLPDNGDITKAGYYLLGWSLADDDMIDPGDYNPGDYHIMENQDLTLFAVWREATEIDYNENGGYEILENAVQTYSGESVQLPDNIDLTKRGYILHGWVDEAVSTNIYAPGEWIAYPDADISLRAIWKTRASGVTQYEDFEGSTPTSHVVNTSYLFYSGYKGTAPDVVIPTSVTTPNYTYENLTMIGPSALTKNTRVKTVEIASGYTTIGNFAFADNPYLTVVKIPASVTSIGVDAFAGNAASFAIEGELGSYAQTYADANGIPFRLDVEGMLTTTLNKTSPDKGGSNGVATFEPTITGIPEGMTARYTLKYSINGGTAFTICSGYSDNEWVPGSELTFTFPQQTRDYTYTFEMDVTLEGVQGQDTSDREQVMVYACMPLNSVTLDTVGDTSSHQVVPIDGIELSAAAVNEDCYSETPTYRFAYRRQGSTKWAYISKAFSESNTIQFVPKTEGVYYFKVEAQSLGRKTKAGDVWDYDYTAYALSKTAEPVKGIYNLTSDKKDYLNGETVTLTMDVTQNFAEDDVEYLMLYSTNGKSFKPFSKVYTPLTIDSGETEIDVPTLPLVKKDTIYYLKVQVRTVGRLEKLPDAYAITQVEFKTAHPVEVGEVGVTHVGSDDLEQQIDATGIVLVADFRPDTEYRFGYQKFGTTKWAYVSSRWSNYNEITFVPKTDGRYRFCVEARSITRKTIDTISEATEYYGLYVASLGAKSARISADPVDYINDIAGNDIEITFSAEGNSTDSYDIRYTYSTNGRSYRVIPGYDWTTQGTTNPIVDESKTLTLPAIRSDSHYYIRIEVKTTGHFATDVFDTTEVDVRMVQPLTSMDSFVSDAEDGVKLLPLAGNTLILTAEANAEATYKFYYRLEGASKWSLISSRYVVDNQAFFRPKKEGAYEFKAEAIALGRVSKTADVSLELSEAVDIWFTSLPAETCEMDVADDDYDFIIGLETEMDLSIFATGNEAGLEYQIVYSTNDGKSYKTLSAWQSLTTSAIFDDMVSCTLPAARRDTRYLIKAQVRSVGRTKSDTESEAKEIWMLKEERNVTTGISIPLESYEYTDTITAQIFISEPVVSGDVEYQLQYSTDNRKWKNLHAHDWTIYNDGGADYILVNLNLAEINGDTLVYIKVNAHMKNSTKIEDFAIDSFMVYNIAPLTSVNLSATLNSTDESITLEALANGGAGHTREYMYSYAMAGQKKTTWIAISSWVESDTVTFTPSFSGDYLFKVEARSKGRLKADVEDVATNEDNGYYLKSVLE